MKHNNDIDRRSLRPAPGAFAPAPPVVTAPLEGDVRFRRHEMRLEILRLDEADCAALDEAEEGAYWVSLRRGTRADPIDVRAEMHVECSASLWDAATAIDALVEAEAVLAAAHAER